MGSCSGNEYDSIAATLVNALHAAVAGTLTLRFGFWFGQHGRTAQAQPARNWKDADQRAAPNLAQIADSLKPDSRDQATSTFTQQSDGDANGVHAPFATRRLRDGPQLGAASMGVANFAGGNLRRQQLKAPPGIVNDTFPLADLAAEPWVPTLDQLEHLIDRQTRKALGLAQRILGDHALAEEVVQDVFLAIWRSGSNLDQPEIAIETFVLNMVHSRAINLRRDRGLYPESQIEGAPELTNDNQLAATAQTSRDEIRVRRALAILPEEQRHTLELAYLDGLTHLELAERLGLAPSVVQLRIRLALDQLRHALAPTLDPPG